MTLRCLKLNATAPSLTDGDRDLISKHGKPKNSKSFNLIRSKIDAPELKSCLDLFPQISQHCYDACVADIRLLLPHIHTGELHTIINLYLDASDERTTFWDGKFEIDNRFVEDEGNGYWNVNPDLIEPAESFIAKKGDVWLLNPLHAHSVLPSLGPEKEMIHRMCTKIDVEITKQKMKSKRKVVQLFFDLHPQEAVERLHG